VITSGWQRSEKWSDDRVRLVKMPPPASGGSVAVGLPAGAEGVPAVGLAVSDVATAGVAVTTTMRAVCVGAGVSVGPWVGSTVTRTVWITI
jgi:acetyl-CoA acetyltransferase